MDDRNFSSAAQARTAVKRDEPAQWIARRPREYTIATPEHTEKESTRAFPAGREQYRTNRRSRRAQSVSVYTPAGRRDRRHHRVMSSFASGKVGERTVHPLIVGRE
ncbi:hypothetical protein K466DRAFT_57148 [Polyporus arcularius HHB13444]|uniref:Uncharacterized protein n=1 Tax=Polyporus arcularius HHB13444 TaxID=1314778 RepID=A0A5C3PI77_9APHY|nr:hypothetical protein K466DRAFT_57148 [Polyporus arcularius HHB13444]